jgi:cytochrome c7-like protein
MCHAWAEHAPIAGVPSMNRCVGCHKFVDRDKDDIKTILEAAEQGHAIEWSRVHRLPDHVFFNHEAHVARAQLRCQECHGEVEKMHVVRQVAPLTMGWCVECHEQRGAPLDCLVCHK